MSKQTVTEKHDEDVQSRVDGEREGDGQDLPRSDNGAASASVENVRHTPGPWRYQIWGDSSFQRGVVETKTAAGVVICDIPKFEVALCAQEVEANARLIAAAPDLLAALKHAIAVVTEWRRENVELIRTPEYQESYDSVLAAIAKAEGRS